MRKPVKWQWVVTWLLFTAFQGHLLSNCQLLIKKGESIRSDSNQRMVSLQDKMELDGNGSNREETIIWNWPVTGHAALAIQLPLVVRCDQLDRHDRGAEPDPVDGERWINEFLKCFISPEPSCVDRCSSVIDPMFPCQCDDNCTARHDCCPDYRILCSGKYTTLCIHFCQIVSAR